MDYPINPNVTQLGIHTEIGVGLPNVMTYIFIIHLYYVITPYTISD